MTNYRKSHHQTIPAMQAEFAHFNYKITCVDKLFGETHKRTTPLINTNRSYVHCCFICKQGKE